MKRPGSIATLLASAYGSLALFALINMAVLAALLAYGVLSGRIDRPKLARIVAVIRGTEAPVPTGEQPTEVQGAASAAGNTSAEKIKQAVAEQEMQQLKTERALSDLRQFSLLVDRRALKLQRQQEQYKAEVAMHKEQLEALREQQLSDAHQKLIATVGTMDSKQSRDYLMSTSSADAVRILLELPDRKRKAIFGSCKTKEQTTWRDRILDAMLKQPVSENAAKTGESAG